jgi:hypothetical protein
MQLNSISLLGIVCNASYEDLIFLIFSENFFDEDLFEIIQVWLVFLTAGTW